MKNAYYQCLRRKIHKKGCRLTINRHPTYTQTVTVFFKENQWVRPSGDGCDGCDGLSFKKKQRRENRERGEREEREKKERFFLEYGALNRHYLHLLRKRLISLRKSGDGCGDGRVTVGDG